MKKNYRPHSIDGRTVYYWSKNNSEKILIPHKRARHHSLVAIPFYLSVFFVSATVFQNMGDRAITRHTRQPRSVIAGVPLYSAYMSKSNEVFLKSLNVSRTSSGHKAKNKSGIHTAIEEQEKAKESKARIDEEVRIREEQAKEEQMRAEAEAEAARQAELQRQEEAREKALADGTNVLHSFLGVDQRSTPADAAEGNVPMEANRSAHPYMPYTAVTNQGSRQYAVLNGADAWSDPATGLRMVGDRICIAIGQGYGMKAGDKVDVVLDDGSVVKCILGDMKALCDTDPNGLYHNTDKDVVEMIVDYNVFSRNSDQYLTVFHGQPVKRLVKVEG